MKKLTKKYKVIFNGKDLFFPLDEKGSDNDVIVPSSFESKEFDSFSDAKNFVDDNVLIYTEKNHYKLVSL